jgi:ribosome-binding protein aMBF1 (putative translation factor)
MATRDRRTPSDVAHELLLSQHPDVREEYERMRPRYEAVAELIRLRKAAGVTQAELAERLGRPQSVISDIESGRRSPRIDTLVATARVLGYDLRVTLAPREPDADAPTTGARPAPRNGGRR